MKKLSILGFTTCLFASSAFANNFYISADIGITKFNQQITLKNLSNETILDKITPFGRIAFGYRFADNFRIEADFNHQRTTDTRLASLLRKNYDDIAYLEHSLVFKRITTTDSFAKYSGGVSLIYDFNNLSKEIIPFVGLRLGLTKYNYQGSGQTIDGDLTGTAKQNLIDDFKFDRKMVFQSILNRYSAEKVLVNASGTSSSKLDNFTPEFGIVLGANYNITENFALGLTYRFDVSTQSKTKASDIINGKGSIQFLDLQDKVIYTIDGNTDDPEDSRFFEDNKVQSSSSSFSFSVTYKF